VLIVVNIERLLRRPAMLLGLDPGSLTRPLGARAFLEGEQCYESNRLVRYSVGCKLVGTVKGTKLWAGECTSLELRTGTPAEESSPTSTPDTTGGAAPKDQQ